MTEEERRKILETPASVIIAPAGHGKTEMISEIVGLSSGKQLILTHTNAGVSALQKRMKKNEIPSGQYSIFTIASFCMQWCMAYPQTAKIDIGVDPQQNPEQYYKQLYTGCRLIFQSLWATRILKATYIGVIVDEYQDCILAQNEIIIELAAVLHTVVLGDPLQGIFDFREPIVNFKTLAFPVINVKTQPWRWERTNPTLGAWLQSIREQLMPTLEGQTVILQLSDIPNCVKLIEPSRYAPYSMISEISVYESVVYITARVHEQQQFAKGMRGLFQHDEIQDCKILFDYARFFDEKRGNELALAVLSFIEQCATGISVELSQFRKHLGENNHDFSRIQKYADVGGILFELCETNELSYICNTIEWLIETPGFHKYRREVLEEMKRCIRFAQERNLTLLESMQLIRRDARLRKRYDHYKYLSSRTLLSKGLEYDCVILDISNSTMSSKNFYVALTRATKMVYIITASKTIMLSC